MSSAPHNVSLAIEGKRYGGWQFGTITQSMEQLASTFSLQYVDQWSDDDEPWPIEAGDSCRVIIDNQAILYGHVDEVRSQEGVDEWNLSASGRSLLGDLVDCSAEGSQWKNRTLHAIADDLLDPYGVRHFIHSEDVGGPFRRFKLEPGETVHQVLQRAAQLRGLVMVDRNSDLYFERAASGAVVDTLRMGDNILRLSRRENHRERFGEYTFNGQTQATDEVSGKSASQLRGTVSDPGVRRHRPLVVTSIGQDGDGDLGKLAIKERNARAGRAERVTVTVDGFTTSNHDLWQPNTLVHVVAPRHHLDATLVVVSARMSFGLRGRAFDAQAMQTELELTRPEAFDQVDYPVRERTEPWQT